MTGEITLPFRFTIWWFTVSMFVHLTESPTVIVTVRGTNPVLVMVACAVLADVAADAGAATIRAAIAVSNRTSLRMLYYPLRLVTSRLPRIWFSTRKSVGIP